MMLMNRKALVFILLFTLPLQACASNATIERVEPPFWWTGFKETGLQLMVYGEGISDYKPSINHDGVTIQRVEKVESPNYLFLYLDIAMAFAGDFDIVFTDNNRELKHTYSLLEKNPDPAHTAGFDGSDAIILITPDRFANGDPSNDNVDGMPDKLNRADKNGRHGGDIKGIADSLDYIQDMGFTSIWLNPVLENNMPAFSYHGYAATDFYRVDAR